MGRKSNAVKHELMAQNFDESIQDSSEKNNKEYPKTQKNDEDHQNQFEKKFSDHSISKFVMK